MSSQCSYGFNLLEVRASVALDAIFLIVYCVIAIVWFIARISHIRRKSPLKWYTYGIGLLALIFASLLSLCSSVLSACDVIGLGRQTQISLAANWFFWLSLILFLATILIPLAGTLCKASSARSPTPVHAVGGGIIAFITIFIIAYLGVLTTRLSGARTSSSLYTRVRTYSALGMVANVFTFLAILFAIVELTIFTLKLRRNSTTSSTGLLIKVIILNISLLGLGILGIVGASAAYRPIYDTEGGYIAYYVFSLLFNALVIIMIFLVGESRIVVDANNNAMVATAPTTNQPVMSNHQQPYPPQTQYQQPYQQPGYSPQPIYQQQPQIPQPYYHMNPQHQTQPYDNRGLSTISPTNASTTNTESRLESASPVSSVPHQTHRT